MGSQPITRLRGQILLAALLALFLTWDLLAILRDQHLGHTDTTLEDLLRLSGLWQSHKGPLPALLAALVRPLVRDPLIAVRLVSVLASTALLTLLCRFAVRIGLGWGGGLLAVAICGTFPLYYGWCRLDVHDPLVALTTLATLAALTYDLGPASAVRLGVACGLGVLSKLSYPIFVIAPGLRYLQRQLRSRHALLGLLAAAGCVAAVVLWWLIPAWPRVVWNLGVSQARVHSAWSENLTFYLQLHGVLPLLTLALVCGLLAWRRRSTTPEPLLALGLSIVAALILLVGVFDTWSRYLLPAVAPASLLVAAGLRAAGTWLARRGRVAWVAPLGVALVALLLGQYVVLNLRGVASPHDERDFDLGMVTPDRRPYTALPRTIAELRRRGWRALEVTNMPAMLGHQPIALGALWAARGQTLPRLTLSEAQVLHRAGIPVIVVLRHAGDALAALGRAHGDGSPPAEQAILAWLALRRVEALSTITDPDGVSFSILRVLP
jgi:hypothetical protein